MPNNQNEWQVLLLQQGLDQLGHAVVILSSRQRVMYASKAAQDILSDECGLLIKENRLVATLPVDQERLTAALSKMINSAENAPNYLNVYIHRDATSRPLELSLSKMPKSADDRREGHYVLIAMKDLNLDQMHWLDRLREKYQLTPREVECVALLAEGKESLDIANIMSIGKETVRHHMKSAYKKMGVHKQHELVSLALEHRRNR